MMWRIDCFLLLLWVIQACKAEYQWERDVEVGSGSGEGRNKTEPVLSNEAIANIAASAAALTVLGAAMCYLILCFERQERMARVRAAQERNRQITRQLEASKQSKRTQKQSPPSQVEEGGERPRTGAENLLFSQEHHSYALGDDESGRSRDPSQPLVTHSPSKRSLT